MIIIQKNTRSYFFNIEFLIMDYNTCNWFTWLGSHMNNNVDN